MPVIINNNISMKRKLHYAGHDDGRVKAEFSCDSYKGSVDI